MAKTTDFETVESRNDNSGTYGLGATTEVNDADDVIRGIMSAVADDGNRGPGKVAKEDGTRPTNRFYQLGTAPYASANLNTISDGGNYRYQGSVVGSPDPSQGGLAIIHISDNSRSQIAVTDDGNIYVRSKNTDTNFTSSDLWSGTALIITSVLTYDADQNRFENSGGNPVSIPPRSMVVLPQSAYDAAVADTGFRLNPQTIFLTT